MATALEILAEEAAGCTKCKLARQGRTQVVFARGDPAADIMFVGEGPGAEEDKQGKPFVGRSGQLLDKLIREEVGVGPERVYVANTVKCLFYTARVQLGDGSWERVSRLVRSRYDGTVMSVDFAGRLVPRRVIGWHESRIADRRIYRLSHRSAKRNGNNRASTWLTGDHEVLTDSGWLAVEDLPPGALVATGQGLTPIAWDVVIGTLLGDAHLNRRAAHLTFSHSAKQQAYARFKARLLEELQPAIKEHRVRAKAGGVLHDVTSVRTRASRALAVVRDAFYAPRKRVPEFLADVLNERMLAIWFMDYGYMRLRPPRQPSAEIATNGFDDVDRRILQSGLATLGLDARSHRGRLHFSVDDAHHLSKLIARYVPPSMRYKLHPEVRDEVPFDPAVYANDGTAETMYDAVDVTPVLNPGTSKTVFCLEVEETNNFVTTGGVVHNCRPPGNRDPEPDEIAACWPWLQQQIDLVDPKVIVTLGNFATKLLLDTKDGITKLRGRQYEYQGRMLIPTFHPAAVLRGGAEQMAQMRADLVRAKVALA